MLLEINLLCKKKKKKKTIFCDFQYICKILFDMNNFIQSFLYIERVKKVNIFLFVGLCLIKGRRVEYISKC